MYKYRIYGLNVSSEYKLDCYPADFENQDIQVNVTFEFDKAFKQKAAYDQTNVNEFVMPDEMGIIYVCNSDLIIVYCKSVLKWKQVQICLLGFSFSFILIKRSIFTFHGNAILHNKKCLLIVGDSGSGKSSLTAAYLAKGDKFLTDDISRVGFTDSVAMIYPSYPFIKICKSTAKQLNIDLSNAIEVFYQNNKYQVSCESFFYQHPAPLHAIICIQPSDRTGVSLIQEKPVGIVQKLIKNTYNNAIASLPEYYQDYNKTIMRILEKVPFYTLYRPKDTFSVSEQISIIDRKLFGSK